MRGVKDVQEQLYAVYPQTKDRFFITAIEQTSLKAQLHVHPDDLRPGATISGPTMFTLADCAFYALILALREDQVQAVTTNVGINFFHRPSEQDLTAEARLLKLGKRLAVGDVLIFSNGIDVAHATITYALNVSNSHI